MVANKFVSTRIYTWNKTPPFPTIQLKTSTTQLYLFYSKSSGGFCNKQVDNLALFKHFTKFHVIFRLPPFALQSRTVTEIDSLKWGNITRHSCRNCTSRWMSPPVDQYLWSGKPFGNHSWVLSRFYYETFRGELRVSGFGGLELRANFIPVETFITILWYFSSYMFN